ncbi:titin isoform X2 [Neocloeon triangulifer]|uniref:titin isoform X2 n=1 Tax=Neocloeon triangulifer TaxID=2078957 RepID=UPI00286F86F5|nr:titin isoform X2 [Neocloeon triangulifer]
MGLQGGDPSSGPPVAPPDVDAPTLRKRAAGAVSPQRPLSTYRWEDVRRARARGGYPWTYLAKWKDRMDHEYEPVSPRRPPQVLVSGPYDRYEPELGMAPAREGSTDSTRERIKKFQERKFLHHDSLDDEMTYIRRAPLNQQNSEEDHAMKIDEHYPGYDRDGAAPSPAGTTSSRTDMDLNTSQVDSSALEDLPLSREARRKNKLDKEAEDQGPGAAARSLQSIRNQAGRLRAKMKAMKRPKINLPDRPKFNLPERPKFHMPERPKFNLPERPKFKLPERPKFNMPERPKFNFPDRPKFNFPERPKFKMPERPNFNFPSISLPRPRRVLREKNGEQETVHTDTPMVDTPSKRSYFDFKTYPRLFDRKNKRRELNISAPVQVRIPQLPKEVYQYDDDEEEIDPIKPDLPPRRKGSQDSNRNRWVSKLSELDYMDEENYKDFRKNGTALPFDDEEEDEEIRQLQKELRKQHSNESDQEFSESLSGFRDKDFGYAISLSPMRPLPPRNNQTLQRAVAPPVDDEEEISLPGSEHGAAHSSGSSSDRRRQGVLEEISSDEFFLREKGVSQEDVDVERYLSREIKETFRPTIDSDVLQLENAANEADLARSYRGTPERVSPSHKARPPRKTRSIKTSSNLSTPPTSVTEVATEVQKVEKEDTTWYFNTFPPNKPTRSRRRQLRQERQKANTMGRKTVPKAPQRKTKTRSEFAIGQNSEWSVAPDQEWLRDIESHIEPKEVANQSSEPDYIIPDVGTPSAPKRGRRFSNKQREDDSRSYVSYTSRASEIEEPGYAYVVKPGVISYEQTQATPPPRRAKGQYPTATRRRKTRPVSGSGTSHFFTMPHRKNLPVRPARNYATLGPARPPRKQRRASLEDVRSESLQSGAVIQKMKERPLPPPPRPPRKDRGSEGDMETMEAEFAALSENAPIAPSEDMDIVRSAEPEKKKDASPTQSEEHVLTAHMIVADSEIVVTREEITCKTPDLPALADDIQNEKSPPQEELSSKIVPASEEQEPKVEEVETIKTISDEREVQSQSEAPMEVEIIPEPTPEVVAEPIKEQLVAEEVAPAAPEQAPEVLTPQKIDSQVIQEEKAIERILIEKVEAAPEAQMQQIILEERVPVVETIQESAQELPKQFEEAPVVEEVTVSTQTDPLPEDELIGDIVPVETEDVGTGTLDLQPQIPVEKVEVPVVAPVPSSSQEISPAAAALLEALRSGQLRLDFLDVGRLSVSELQAGRMLVSDIEGMALNVADLQSKGGALVLSSVQAPMEALAEALMTAAQRIMPPPPVPQIIHVPNPPPPHSDMQCQTQTPMSTPPPQESQLITRAVEPVAIEASEFVDSESTQERISSSEVQHSAPSTSSSSLPVFTTEQVLALQAAAVSSASRERSRDRSIPPPLPPRRTLTPDYSAPLIRQQDMDPGIVELGNRLARACCCATLSALRRVVTYTELQANSLADETRERSGLQMALCVVLVLVAGIILVASMGGDSSAVHHHHWDFYMPQ